MRRGPTADGAAAALDGPGGMRTDRPVARGSAQQHRSPGFAQHVADGGEEARSLLAVDEPVIERQAEGCLLYTSDAADE